ncbi:hypothetical protein BSY19_4834 (plasmid) [Bosea sp. RAC05]|nr:hypothetical protein BSY19_4834 [Bosea sp. RAC05]
MKLAVHVPKIGSKAAGVIAPRSAIVSDPSTNNERGILCYFEGNILGAPNMKAFHDRICVAAGRLEQDYPTKAVARFPVADLVPVALYDTALRAITTVYNGEMLANWADEPLIEITGRRLPAGQAEWDLAIIAAKGARPVAHGQIDHVLPFRTRAGQLFFFYNDGSKQVEVLGDDDPRLILFSPESASAPGLLS